MIMPIPKMIMPLIQTFGENWGPDVVDWGKQGGQPGALLGRVGGKKRDHRQVNVWEERGVYVLLHDRVPVYVGKTGRKALGVRLREHRTDECAGLWDQFSWYGIVGIRNKQGSTKEAELKKMSERVNEKTESVIDTLEAVMIRTMHRQLANRQVMGLKAAKPVYQEGLDDPRALRSVLSSIERRLDTIESVSASADRG